jgi:hypothetical protein
MRKLELPPLDLDGSRCPAFRRALGLESKSDRVDMRFQIDKPLADILVAHADQGHRSDFVNQGLNLLALMNNWI